MHGREKELADVANLIRQHRLTTIVGPGGVGKSTLAHAVGETLDDPALITNLAPLDEHGLDEEVAGDLGFRSWADLGSHLDRQSTLLIVDNAEHLIESVTEVISKAMDSFGGLKVLLTSREPLGIPGERVYALKPMDLTGRPSEAAILFHRFLETRGLAPKGEPAEIERLCSSLDGLPLALELAAGLASVLSPAEIRASVETRLDLLTRERPAVPSRVSSLDATIAWSIDLLSAESRAFLESLSVFDGPFSLELATSMEKSRDPATAVRLLRGLADRSLLIHESSGGLSWYRLLNTIRTHCRQRLVSAGGLNTANDCMVDAVVSGCTRLSRPDVFMGDPTVPDEVSRTFRIVRTAIQWCLAHDVASTRAKQMILPLTWLEDLGHQAEGADLVNRVIQRWPEAATGVEWGVLATLHKAAGHLEEAMSAAEKAVSMGDTPGLVLGHRLLGIVIRQSGRPEDSSRHFESGAAAAREEGWEAQALELEAHSALAAAAMGHVDDGLDTLRDLETRSQPYPLCHRCVALFHSHLLMSRDPSAARALASRLLEEAREYGHTWALGGAAYQVAVTAFLAGDATLGLEHLALALEAFEEAHVLTELHGTLLLAASVLDDAGLRDEGAMARAGLAGLPPRSMSVAELELLHLLDVDIDQEPDFSVTYDPDRVVASIRALGAKESTIDSAPTRHENRFMPRGDVWEVAYGGEAVFVRDSKGMQDLRALLGSPGREVAAVDLMGAGAVQSDTGPALDQRARSHYEERIRDLQEEIDQAEQDNDPHRADLASRELDQLVEQLSAAFGLGGRSRRSGETAERARSAVTWRIRAAIDRITGELPALGEHLDRSVQTGRFCVYRPERATEWATSSTS